MARRNDHTPEELKNIIRETAEDIIQHKGLNKLTARTLGAAVGYAPGTIYNFYRDMDALAVEINYATLGRMGGFCMARMMKQPADYSRVRALAGAYVDFALANRMLWQMLYAARPTAKASKLPRAYSERMTAMFGLIETTLTECLAMPKKEATAAARLLWACLHGITVLTLDGRLQMSGAAQPETLIDDLLNKYLQKPAIKQRLAPG